MIGDEENQFCPRNKEEWRQWLKDNHVEAKSVWLVIHKKSSPTPNLSWSEAVDQALCFGWIDSVKKSIDKDKYKQYFCKRKANSTWSKINKEKIKKLKEEGLMYDAGLKSVDIAKQNGCWNILDNVEELNVPEDMKS